MGGCSRTSLQRKRGKLRRKVGGMYNNRGNCNSDYSLSTSLRLPLTIGIKPVPSRDTGTRHPQKIPKMQRYVKIKNVKMTKRNIISTTASTTERTTTTPTACVLEKAFVVTIYCAIVWTSKTQELEINHGKFELQNQHHRCAV